MIGYSLNKKIRKKFIKNPIIKLFKNNSILN